MHDDCVTKPSPIRLTCHTPMARSLNMTVAVGQPVGCHGVNGRKYFKVPQSTSMPPSVCQPVSRAVATRSSPAGACRPRRAARWPRPLARRCAPTCCTCQARRKCRLSMGREVGEWQGACSAKCPGLPPSSHSFTQ